MRKLMSVLAAALALGVVVPGAANAQARQKGRVTAGDVVRPAGTGDRDNRDVRDRDVRDRDRRDDDWYNRSRDSRDDDWDSDRNGKNGKGPAFCRSGAGHPVHGRQWCRDKGFGLGNNNGRYDNGRYDNGRWDRVTWEDVIFRRRPRAGSFGSDVLQDVLGGSVYNRIATQRRYWGVNSPLVGRWDMMQGRSVLLVSAGGIPLAQLVDRNNDRRVDLVSLYRR